jgi:hypothetical protein
MKGLILLGVAILMMVTVAHAQERKIELKKSFWSGWKYSIDGSEFKKVGMTGSDLAAVMNSNPSAVDEMNTYRTRRITAGSCTNARNPRDPERSILRRRMR